MRQEGKYSYQERADNTWIHKKSGVEVVRLTPSQFMVRIPNRESKDILGDDAEARAFLVAELFIGQLSRSKKVAALLIENREVVLTFVLEAYLGNEDLRDYLGEHLPDAKCELIIGSSGPSGSFEEYTITIDAIQESVLLLTLRDFCDKNGLSHQIDIANDTPEEEEG